MSGSGFRCTDQVDSYPNSHDTAFVHRKCGKQKSLTEEPWPSVVLHLLLNRPPYIVNVHCQRWVGALNWGLAAAANREQEAALTSLEGVGGEAAGPIRPGGRRVG